MNNINKNNSMIQTRNHSQQLDFYYSPIKKRPIVYSDDDGKKFTISKSIPHESINTNDNNNQNVMENKSIQNQSFIRSIDDLPVFVTIENYRIASYHISGEPYLCLPQLLQYLKEKFLLKKMIEKFEESMIYFTEALPKHVEGFIKASVLPPDAKSCPLIKRSDADRICLALYEQCYKGKPKNMVQMCMSNNKPSSSSSLSLPTTSNLSSFELEPAQCESSFTNLSTTFRRDSNTPHKSNISYSIKNNFTSINDNFQQAMINLATSSGCNMIAPVRPLFDKEAACSILSLAKSVSSTLMIRVYHRCFGKCVGLYYPNLLFNGDYDCIECSSCHIMFSPRRFIGHTHGTKENNVCHWGFNSHNWHYYIRLSRKQTMNKLDDEELLSQFKFLLATAQRETLLAQQSTSSSTKRSYDQMVATTLAQSVTQNYHPNQYHRNSKRLIDDELYCDKNISDCSTEYTTSYNTTFDNIMGAHYNHHNEIYYSPVKKRSIVCRDVGGNNYITSKPISKVLHHTITNDLDRSHHQQYSIKSVEELPIFVTIENYRIASYIISGEPYLCLPQLLQYLKEKFLLKKMIEKFEESMIHFTEAIPRHIEGFIRASVLPPDAKSCPLIKRSDADRICLELYEQCYKGKKRNMVHVSSNTATTSSNLSSLSTNENLCKSLSTLRGENDSYESNVSFQQLSYQVKNNNYLSIHDNLRQAMINLVTSFEIANPTNRPTSTKCNMIAPVKPLFDKEAALSLLSFANSITSSLMIRVYHRCFGKCVGLYHPNLLFNGDYVCIECSSCHIMFSPRRFIGHTHGTKENNVCHWGFNSHNWHHYIRLSRKQTMNNLDEDELFNQFKLLQAIITEKSFLEQLSNDDGDYEFDNPRLNEINNDSHGKIS